MPASLANQFIADLYTSLLHLSGLQLGTELNYVYDGVGNQTGIALSGARVVINNIIQPQVATAIQFIDYLYPIGSVILTTTNTNPGQRFTGTTWSQTASGRFLTGVGVGSDGSTTRSFNVGNNTGQYRSTLPPHKHGVGRFTETFNNDVWLITGDWSDSNSYSMRYMPGDSIGTSTTIQVGTPNGIKTSLPIETDTTQINNTPPSFGVYVWERTA